MSDSLSSRIKRYAKRHTFHFVVIIAIGLGIAVSISQYSILAVLNKKIDDNRKASIEKISSSEITIQKSTNVLAASINKNIDAVNATTNARIDTIDSTIKPELKRRELVKKVRTAITENTRQSIDIRTLNKITNSVIDYSYEFNLPIAATLAQMKVESNFNLLAKSHAGAKGLMQIIDPTAAEIASDLGHRRYNIWNPLTNIKFGCYYMSKVLNAFDNNYEDALRAYNFGPHHVLQVKTGEIDLSHSRTILVDGLEKQFLIDKKYGKFILDEDGSRILIREEHKYPQETINYVKSVKKYRKLFSTYGLDKVE